MRTDSTAIPVKSVNSIKLTADQSRSFEVDDILLGYRDKEKIRCWFTFCSTINYPRLY